MNKITGKKQLLAVSVIFTTILYLLAHSYRLFNNMFSGDSIVALYQNDSAWQIALGRIFQPVYFMFRGTICNPWLISFLAIFYIATAVFFIADIFKFKSIYQVIFTCGILTCNIALTAANATYLPWVDIYGLALLASVLGVWLVSTKKILQTVCGILCLSLSLGLYQAYISVAISLIMIILLFNLVEGISIKEFFIKVARYVVSLLIAAIIYYICWKIFQRAFGIWTSDSYNGLSSVGDYSDTSLLGLIGLTYRQVRYYFVNPSVFKTLVLNERSLSFLWTYLLRVVNIGALILTVYALVKINIKNKTSAFARIMQGVILLLLPLGVNIICIISKGTVHTLMVFSFAMLYIPMINMAGPLEGKKISIKEIITAAIIFCVIWNNIVLSNQVYLKKSLQDKANLSLMTKIAYEVEHMEGYEPGVTPVAITGSFQETDYITDITDWEDIVIYGVGKTTMLYPGTDYAYLKYELNVTMNLTRVDKELDEVKEMPCYPAEGSIKYVDGVVVVKISK